MSWATELAEDAVKAARHHALARTFWSKVDGKEDDVEPAPVGHPGDPAVSVEQPAEAARLAVVAAARELRRAGRVALAGPAAVSAPAQPRITRPGACGFTAEKVTEGPWGPAWWVVRDLATRQEVARYPSYEADGPGAILRYLQEEHCWRQQMEREPR